MRYHRALVVATGLGESKRINGKKHQFLVEGEQPFLLGALFRPFENGCVSCAVITRDAHPRFDAYHDKAFPCFLPPNAEFIDQWLNETGEVPNAVADYLNHPRIVVPLKVSPVKAFKHGHVDYFADTIKADAD